MNDDWLRAAVTDAALVADLLLRLKDIGSSTPLPTKPQPYEEVSTAAVSAIPAWGVKQPRTRGGVSKKESSVSTRWSPTSPLSWSGSGCGGAASTSGGYEESSAVRSNKTSAIIETTTTSTLGSKRPRRKKTFAELKEEENALLKEQTFLQKELATFRVTLKEQRSINENLKRMKVDFHTKSGIKSESNSYEPEELHDTLLDAQSHINQEVILNPECSKTKDVETGESKLALPDLNMIPGEECVN